MPFAPALRNPPNHKDSVFLELPSGTDRGAGVWATIYFILFLIFWIGFSIKLELRLSELSPILVVSGAIGFPIIIGIFFYMWRMDTEPPLDEPIRFNRLRRKVYAYKFRSNGLKLFSRSEWGVESVSYEWDNIRAEFSSFYGPMGSGGLTEVVYLAAIDPTTGAVIDRFVLTYGKIEGEMYWAMAQLYMQKGPGATPDFETPPRDWNNEYHFENIARRLAPKVKWPGPWTLSPGRRQIRVHNNSS